MQRVVSERSVPEVEEKNRLAKIQASVLMKAESCWILELPHSCYQVGPLMWQGYLRSEVVMV